MLPDSFRAMVFGFDQIGPQICHLWADAAPQQSEDKSRRRPLCTAIVDLPEVVIVMGKLDFGKDRPTSSKVVRRILSDSPLSGGSIVANVADTHTGKSNGGRG